MYTYITPEGRRRLSSGDYVLGRAMLTDSGYIYGKGGALQVSPSSRRQAHVRLWEPFGFSRVSREDISKVLYTDDIDAASPGDVSVVDWEVKVCSEDGKAWRSVDMQSGMYTHTKGRVDGVQHSQFTFYTKGVYGGRPDEMLMSGSVVNVFKGNSVLVIYPHDETMYGFGSGSSHIYSVLDVLADGRTVRLDRPVHMPQAFSGRELDVYVFPRKDTVSTFHASAMTQWDPAIMNGSRVSSARKRTNLLLSGRTVWSYGIPGTGFGDQDMRRMETYPSSSYSGFGAMNGVDAPAWAMIEMSQTKRSLDMPAVRFHERIRLVVPYTYSHVTGKMFDISVREADGAHRLVLGGKDVGVYNPGSGVMLVEDPEVACVLDGRADRSFTLPAPSVALFSDRTDPLFAEGEGGRIYVTYVLVSDSSPYNTGKSGPSCGFPCMSFASASVPDITCGHGPMPYAAEVDIPWSNMPHVSLVASERGNVGRSPQNVECQADRLLVLVQKCEGRPSPSGWLVAAEIADKGTTSVVIGAKELSSAYPYRLTDWMSYPKRTDIFSQGPGDSTIFRGVLLGGLERNVVSEAVYGMMVPEKPVRVEGDNATAHRLLTGRAVTAVAFSSLEDEEPLMVSVLDGQQDWVENGVLAIEVQYRN